MELDTSTTVISLLQQQQEREGCGLQLIISRRAQHAAFAFGRGKDEDCESFRRRVLQEALTVTDNYRSYLKERTNERQKATVMQMRG